LEASHAGDETSQMMDGFGNPVTVMTSMEAVPEVCFDGQKAVVT